MPGAKPWGGDKLAVEKTFTPRCEGSYTGENTYNRGRDVRRSFFQNGWKKMNEKGGRDPENATKIDRNPGQKGKRTCRLILGDL